MKKPFVCAVLMTATVCGLLSCSSQRKAMRLKEEGMGVDIAPAGSKRLTTDTSEVEMLKSDTLVVYDINGKELMFAEAVEDKETGEMIASYTLAAAVVTARTRNVAERHGEVDLVFELRVPRQFMENEWQTRFYPRLSMLDEETSMDMVILTGPNYRRAQLRGYQRYNRFIAGIVSDTTKFIHVGALETFLERNLPAVYAFRMDSSEVSEEAFASAFGITEAQATDHYTNKVAKRLNAHRLSRRDAVFRRHVKAPIVTEGVRLDTVFEDVTGDFVYEYVQTVRTRPGLRKAEITLSGEVYEQEMLMYGIPECEPLTYYISSLSSFTDDKPRYLTHVVSRRAEANSEYRIEFPAGRSVIDPSIGDNASEMARIRRNLFNVMLNREFDLDSVVVSAYASPEGSDAVNRSLSAQRAESAVEQFRPYIGHLRDSLRTETVYVVEANDDYSTNGAMKVETADWQNVSFRTSVGGENWALLDRLVAVDTVLTEKQVMRYQSLAGLGNDVRESAMAGDDYYSYVRESLYPALRTVNFNFFLHRKGMVKDTVHTTELDTVYMKGVQAIRDRDYATACEVLAPYADFNTAVAYLADDRNLSALEILEPMERTAVINYMMAILHARLGDEQAAVQCYILSCAQERSYVSRGNLDPEISALIKKYRLNREEEDDWLTLQSDHQTL